MKRVALISCLFTLLAVAKAPKRYTKVCGDFLAGLGKDGRSWIMLVGCRPNRGLYSKLRLIYNKIILRPSSSLSEHGIIVP